MVQIKPLRKSDFKRDVFNIFVKDFIDEKQLRPVLLAYRLAKYAQLNSGMNVKRPMIAANTLLSCLHHVFDNRSAYHLTILLFVHYISRRSYFLTEDDITATFYTRVNTDNSLLMDLDKILSSRSTITPAKLKVYKQKFSPKIIAIKAAEVIAKLKTLDFEHETSYLLKVYKRYQKIFQIYPTINILVSAELREHVYKFVNSDYINSSSQRDLLQYYTILK